MPFQRISQNIKMVIAYLSYTVLFFVKGLKLEKEDILPKQVQANTTEK